MSRAIFRCKNCGSRTEVLMTESEKLRLRGEHYLDRYCRECRGTTHWEHYKDIAGVGFAEEGPAEVGRARILLIDDDEDILVVLGKALSKADYELETANSARKAVTLLARGDYDVILSDIRMPDFDGRQLFEFLDEHLPEHKERVIFLTGDTGNPKTLEFLQSVKRPYLSKPINLEALMKLVAEHAGERSGSA